MTIIDRRYLCRFKCNNKQTIKKKKRIKVRNIKEEKFLKLGELFLINSPKKASQ